MFIRLTLIALTAVLPACYTAADYAGNEDSPFYLVPRGSRLTLQQPLSIPPNQAGVFIQNGEPRLRRGVQFYYPHCRLELNTVSDVARTVAPDEIVVLRSYQEEHQGPYTAAGGGLYARAALQLVDIGVFDGGPGLYSFLTHMNLRSQKQPDIARLICLQWGDHGMRHLTIAEIRKTLGDLFALETNVK